MTTSTLFVRSSTFLILSCSLGIHVRKKKILLSFRPNKFVDESISYYDIKVTCKVSIKKLLFFSKYRYTINGSLRRENNWDRMKQKLSH